MQLEKKARLAETQPISRTLRSKKPLNERLLDAARNRSLPDAREALAQGAEVDARSVTRMTPLMIAVWKGDIGMARFLLGEGADADARSATGNNTLMMAILSHCRESHEIAEMLVDHGADVRAVNNYGCDAVTLAAQEGREDIRALLQRRGAI